MHTDTTPKTPSQSAPRAEPADRRRADAPATWPFGTLTQRQQRARRSFEIALGMERLAKWPAALL